MYTSVLCVFFVTQLVHLCSSARILGVVLTPSYSHQIVFQPLWKELLLRGHELTVLTTDPINNASLINLTEIDLHFSYKLWNENVLEVMNSNDHSILQSLDKVLPAINDMYDRQLQHPQVQALIKNETEHFDLLIVEFVAPIAYVFAERFNCPFIGMLSMDLSYVYESVGNPSHPVLNPDTNFPFQENLNFYQRLIVTIFDVFGKPYFVKPMIDVQQKLVYKHFGDRYTSLKEIHKNVSMLFVNADQFFYPVRSLVPAVVQIGGGTHRQASRPLPKDLQLLLDGASQGFIYFSLGTNVKSKTLSDSLKRILLETFAELPYLVLWKFEHEDLPNKPKNVYISKWFPQQDILKHPNIKLFITQGGLQSIEEAMYSHVPIVGMPFFGDQPGNINRLVSRGVALHVDYATLDKDFFKATILEVINNPKYRNKAEELAKLAQDQPMTGLEKAVWWTEYVIRHKGAHHLRSPALDIPLYQYFLLDVICFCLVTILACIYLLKLVINISFKLVKNFAVKSRKKVE